MEIKVKLPNPSNGVNGTNIKSFIRQLELCVHHIQKTYEQMEKDKQINEDSFITFRFPKIDYDKYYEIYENQLELDIEVEIASN